MNSKLEDLCHSWMHCGSIQECWDLYLAYTDNLCGFDHGLLMLSGKSNIREVHIEKDCFSVETAFISNYDLKYLIEYKNMQGDKVDIGTLTALKYGGAVEWSGEKVWSHILNDEVSSHQIQVELLGIDYGLNHGFTFILYDANNKPIGGLGICSPYLSGKAYQEARRYISEAYKAAKLMHAFANRFSVYHSCFDSAELGISRLDRKELEALYYLRNGLSMEQISDKTASSIHTVYGRVKNLKIKLKSNNRNDLIVKSWELGVV